MAVIAKALRKEPINLKPGPIIPIIDYRKAMLDMEADGFNAAVDAVECKNDPMFVILTPPKHRKSEEEYEEQFRNPKIEEA